MHFTFIEALEAIYNITNEVSRLQLRMLFEYENVTVIASYVHMYNIEVTILYTKGVACPSLIYIYTTILRGVHLPLFDTGRRPIPFARRKTAG